LLIIAPPLPPHGSVVSSGYRPPFVSVASIAKAQWFSAKTCVDWRFAVTWPAHRARGVIAAFADRPIDRPDFGCDEVTR
jgi:hypothetical protein